MATFWSVQEQEQDLNEGPNEDDVNVDSTCGGNDDEPFDFERNENNVRNNMTLYLLRFTEKGRVPQTVVDSFLENATDIVQNSIELIKSGLVNSLQTAGTGFDDLAELRNLFDDINNLNVNPFSGIEKEALQHQYYTKTISTLLSCKNCPWQVSCESEKGK